MRISNVIDRIITGKTVGGEVATLEVVRLKLIN